MFHKNYIELLIGKWEITLWLWPWPSFSANKWLGPNSDKNKEYGIYTENIILGKWEEKITIMPDAENEEVTTSLGTFIYKKAHLVEKHARGPVVRSIDGYVFVEAKLCNLDINKKETDLFKAINANTDNFVGGEDVFKAYSNHYSLLKLIDGVLKRYSN